MFCVTLLRLNLPLCISLYASHSWPISKFIGNLSFSFGHKLTDEQPDNTADAVFLDRRFMGLWLYVVR